jgi:hypothetical protein
MRVPSGVLAEYEVLRCAAGVLPAPEKDATLRHWIGERPDWSRLLRRARWHRVAGLLWQALASRSDVPTSVRYWLDAYHAGVVKRNLHRTAQLAQIVDCFDREGIGYLAFKGPTLAALAYGDLGLRDFLDLDVLVRPGDARPAIGALVSLGFRPRVKSSTLRADAFFESENALSFKRNDVDSLVELHWALTPKYVPIRYDADAIWESFAIATPGGRSIRTLSAEPLVLFLCVHAAKHYWDNLGWVSDVARMITPALDWDRLVSQAEKAGSQRMLFLGLLLARNLMGSTLPERVEARIAADAMAAELSKEIEARFASDTRHPNPLKRLRFHLRMCDRVRNRVTYSVRMALTPSVRDFESVRLPRYLSVLYQPMRPFRLVRDLASQSKRP